MLMTETRVALSRHFINIRMEQGLPVPTLPLPRVCQMAQLLLQVGPSPRVISQFSGRFIFQHHREYIWVSA